MNTFGIYHFVRKIEREKKKARKRELREAGVVSVSRKKLRGNTMANSQCKQRVAIDCSFDHLMTNRVSFFLIKMYRVLHISKAQRWAAAVIFITTAMTNCNCATAVSVIPPFTVPGHHSQNPNKTNVPSNISLTTTKVISHSTLSH